MQSRRIYGLDFFSSTQLPRLFRFHFWQILLRKHSSRFSNMGFVIIFTFQRHIDASSTTWKGYLSNSAECNISSIILLTGPWGMACSRLLVPLFFYPCGGARSGHAAFDQASDFRASILQCFLSHRHRPFSVLWVLFLGCVLLTYCLISNVAKGIFSLGRGLGLLLSFSGLQHNECWHGYFHASDAQIRYTGNIHGLEQAA